MLSIRQPNGVFGVQMEVGNPFRVRVENRLSDPTLIHWHGLTPPWRQGGVPNISSPPIASREAADYDFYLAFAAGTFFMHSHEGLQKQLLMSAPLIIRDPHAAKTQEIVIELADFSFRQPEEIYADLRKPAAAADGKMADATAMGMPSASHAMNHAAKAAMSMRGDAKPDLNDVKHDAFLANRRALGDPEVIKDAPVDPVLLRVINSSALSAYNVDLGGLEGVLSAVDGHPVAPVRGSRFPIAVAQRLDHNVTIPKEAAAYPVLAILEGEPSQTGVILVAGDAVVRRVADLAHLTRGPN